MCFFFFLPLYGFLITAHYLFIYYSLKFFLNFLSFLIRIQLLYNVLLVSAVQQSEPTLCMHIFPPSWTSLPPPRIPPLQVITGHQGEPPVLSSRFPLASYLTHSICPSQSPSSFPYLSPMSTLPFPTSASLVLS